MNEVIFDDVAVRLDLYRKSRHEIMREYVATAIQQGNDEQFLVCDIGDIIEKYQQWERLLPRVKMYYAVKCNTDRAVLKVLADLGAFFDCASKDEISKVLSLDVSPKCIIYTHPHKSVSSLTFSAHKNVSLMTFDSEGELYKIKAHYPDAKLVLRILPDQTYDPLKYFGYKFGCLPQQFRDILYFAKELQLNVIGVSFHVGSEMKNPLSYKAALERSKDAFDIAKEMGFKMKLLDIGGGFPGEQNTFDLFKKFAHVITDTLDDLFPCEDGVEVIAEPGRYVVSSACTAVVNIFGKRVIPKTFLQKEDVKQLEDNSTETQSKVYMYYLNGSVFADFMVGTLFHPGSLTYIPKMIKTVEAKEKHESVLWGFTCTGDDCLNPSLLIPELEDGDWIYFEDMGAYTRSVASNFNGFATPRIKYHCLVEKWQQVYPNQNEVTRD